MQPHYRDYLWASAHPAGKAYGQAASTQAGQLQQALSPCVLAVTRALNHTFGAHHDMPDLARAVVNWSTGRTRRRARSIIQFQMRWGALRSEVPAAERSRFLKASLRGLRRGGCLVRPTRTRRARFSGDRYGAACLFPGFPPGCTPAGAGTGTGTGTGAGAGAGAGTGTGTGAGTGTGTGTGGSEGTDTDTAGGGAGSGNTQSFDPNAFANILGASLQGVGALFGGIAQIHTAVNASGGDASALSDSANAQLQTSANELAQSKSDLADAILNNNRLAEQMAQDRMNQSIANAANTVNDEQGSGSGGLGAGAWVGIGLGGVAVVGLIAFLAMRGGGGAANFDYSY